MKISEHTKSVLKNFSATNPSIGLFPGNFVSVISRSADMFAQAEIEEQLPETVDNRAIFQMDRVLSVLDLVEDAEVDFTTEEVTITGDSTTARYSLSDRSLVNSKEPNTAKESFLDFEFDVSHDDIKNILKSGQVLQLPHIVIEGKGGEASISAVDVETKANSYKIDLGSYNATTDFKLVFDATKIKLLPYNYRVKVDRKMFVNLTATDSKLELRYWIAAKKNFSNIEE